MYLLGFNLCNARPLCLRYMYTSILNLDSKTFPAHYNLTELFLPRSTPPSINSALISTHVLQRSHKQNYELGAPGTEGKSNEWRQRSPSAQRQRLATSGGLCRWSSWEVINAVLVD
jgi:hypothetical protein